MLKFRNLFWLGLLLSCVGGGFANPLAGLPSAPRAGLDAIVNLGEGQWLDLGSPASDPTWGNARGRSWGGGDGMVLIPHLRGAIITGEGRHAYVKPNGFGMDDYWFYDINQHQWICLYPGTDTQNFNARVAAGEIKVDAVVHVVDSAGAILPGHNFIHAWGFLTYDPHRKRFTAMSGNGYGSYFFPGWDDVSTGVTALQTQGLGKYGSAYTPWYYNVDQGKFERFQATNNSPLKKSDYGQFEYLTKSQII